MPIIRSQCGRCSMGCGIRAYVGSDRDVRIDGDMVHPANGGALCDRGLMLAEDAEPEARLLRPMVDGRAMGWDRAIPHVARRLSAIMDRRGVGSIALHVGGGLLTEDYYVANKLMKGFLGSAHIHAPWTAAGGARGAHVAAFGEDVMPAAFEDIERADTILLLGGAIARSHPVLFERVQAAREGHGARLVAMVLEDEEPLLDADLALRLPRDGMARWLGGALLHLHDGGALDPARMARLHVPSGFWDMLRPGHDIWSIARACGQPPAMIRAFYDLWASGDRVVTLWHEDAGRAAYAAAINLHLATGRIGRAGNAPFALPAAANGMGGREVDCTADRLAAHRDFSAGMLDDVGRFWGARHLADRAGLDGEALLRAMRDGAVKALWSIGADDGAAEWLREARAIVPFSIRSVDRIDRRENWSVCLPSASWLEKDGTLTGMDRLISRHRRLFDLTGEAKPDWWMLTRVAQAMGWADCFHYERPADIYREHVRLTAYRNDGARLLNLKRHAPISNPAYDELTPWRWGEVPFDEGRFPTPDGRASLIPPIGLG